MRRNPDKPLRSKTPLRATKRLGLGAKAKERAKKTGSALRQYSDRPNKREEKQRDREWAATIWPLYDGLCVLSLPGCWRKPVQAMHLFNKTDHDAFRWSPWNGLPGCPACHKIADHDLKFKTLFQQSFERIAREREQAHLGLREPMMLEEIHAMLADARTVVVDAEERKQRRRAR